MLLKSIKVRINDTLEKWEATHSYVSRSSNDMPCIVKSRDMSHDLCPANEQCA
jgi:hypothetical protein